MEGLAVVTRAGQGQLGSRQAQAEVDHADGLERLVGRPRVDHRRRVAPRPVHRAVRSGDDRERPVDSLNRSAPHDVREDGGGSQSGGFTVHGRQCARPRCQGAVSGVRRSRRTVRAEASGRHTGAGGGPAVCRPLVTRALPSRSRSNGWEGVLGDASRRGDASDGVSCRRRPSWQPTRRRCERAWPSCERQSSSPWRARWCAWRRPERSSRSSSRRRECGQQTP